VLNKLVGVIKYFYTRLFKIRMTNFRGGFLLLNDSQYNSSWDNERSIEVPLIQNAYESLGISKFNKDEINVLEIGNVLSNYEKKLNHDIVDKYEKGPRVKNVDFLDFKPKKKYDYIFSISTFEHIGYDYTEKLNLKKAIKALRKVLTMLKPKGKAYITIPVGFNKALDKEVMKGIKCYNTIAFKRTCNWGNDWEQCSVAEAAKCKYGEPFPNANAIFVLFKDLNKYDVTIDSEEMILIGALLERTIEATYLEDGDFDKTINVCEKLLEKVIPLLKKEIEFEGGINN